MSSYKFVGKLLNWNGFFLFLSCLIQEILPEKTANLVRQSSRFATSMSKLYKLYYGFIVPQARMMCTHHYLE